MGKQTDQDTSIAEAAAATVWQPGLKVDRFTLVGKIATGGMAEIWLARQAGLKGFEKMVVIKKILDSHLQTEGFVEEFLDEARTAALLTHPNVVQIFDLGQFESSYFIAMEYIAGETLSRIARASARLGKPVSYCLAAWIVQQAAEGLGYAHTKTGTDGQPLNIVHRDVSPQNLMITYDGQLKVLDFGIAKAANRTTQTEAGKFKGKIAYMAPEQAKAQPQDARADIFALGIILYELVGRCRLFDFNDPVQGLMAVSSNDPIPSVKTRNPWVPDALDAICARALQRNRADRFQSAAEMAQALETWVREQPDAPTKASISAFMQDLFSERIANQQKMLLAIKNDDFAVLRARSVTGEHSMPGSQSGPVRRRAPLLALVGAGVALMLVAAGIYAFTLLGVDKSRVAPPPKPLPASLQIDTDPTGAALTLDGKEIGDAPQLIGEIALGEHTVRASAAHYAPTERTVNIERVAERTNVLLTLKPEAAEPAADAGGGATPIVKAFARGRLTLTTVPWSEVYLGTRKLGDTPLVEVTVPAGKLSLRLVNPDNKLEKTITVEIKAGQTTSLKQKL